MTEPENFIRVYENAFPVSMCSALIDLYEYNESMGCSFPRTDEEVLNTKKRDNSIVLNRQEIINNHYTFNIDNSALVKPSNEILWECYRKYSKDITSITLAEEQVILSLKVQKTRPSEGYHIWHYENAGRVHSSRVAVFLVYLNDVRDGGETEFLYQRLRVEPKEGTVVIWPAAYTHMHRGNPPLKNNKYILTGWFEYR